MTQEALLGAKQIQSDPKPEKGRRKVVHLSNANAAMKRIKGNGSQELAASEKQN